MTVTQAGKMTLAERRRQVAELYRLGTKDSVIAMILNLTESQVRHVRQRMGLASPRRAYLQKTNRLERDEAPIDEAEIDLMAIVFDLNAEGFPIADIALRVGKPVEVVKKIAKKMPKSWKTMGNGRDQNDFGRTVTNQLPGTRRGGGTKRLPE